MHRLIVRTDAGEQIGIKKIDITKLPSTFAMRTAMLRGEALKIVKNSSADLGKKDLRWVLISHSNRAVIEGSL